MVDELFACACKVMMSACKAEGGDLVGTGGFAGNGILLVEFFEGLCSVCYVLGECFTAGSSRIGWRKYFL